LSALPSTATFACRTFRTEAARRVVPGLALHVDLGPDDFAGAGLGLVLALLAAGSGFRVPVGGAPAITDALLTRLGEHGGELRLGAHVDQIVVREHRAVGVRLRSGEEIAAAKAVVADVGAPALYLKLLPPRDATSYMRQRMKAFRYGWGTFK